MKIKLNASSEHTSHPSLLYVIKEKEYSVLGYGKGFYYIVDEENQFIRLSSVHFIVTDNSIPSFWREDSEFEGSFMPEEWHFNSFKWQFPDGVDDIYFELNQENELWIQTQFAKGYRNYNFDKLPNQFQNGENDAFKIDIINAYLKLIQDITNDNDYCHWEYRFGDFSNLINLETIYWRNGKSVKHEDTVVTADKGFEYLVEILSDLFSTNLFDNSNVYTRNRLLFTIWSVFGCFDFSVTKRTFNPGSQKYYILKKDEKAYFLSVDYFT